MEYVWYYCVIYFHSCNKQHCNLLLRKGLRIHQHASQVKPLTQQLCMILAQCRKSPNPNSRATFRAALRQLPALSVNSCNRFLTSSGGPCNKKDTGGAPSTSLGGGRSNNMSPMHVTRENMTYKCNHQSASLHDFSEPVVSYSSLLHLHPDHSALRVLILERLFKAFCIL